MTDNAPIKNPVIVAGVEFSDTLGLHELRLVDKRGRTFSVLLDIKELAVDRAFVPGMDTIKMTSVVRRVNSSKGTDYRLDNQRKSIQELLDHLKHHCPALQGPDGQCDYKDPMPATEEEVNHEAQ